MKDKMLYRHGDVVIERVTEAPSGSPLKRDARGHVVLAEGEATGHAHRIKSEGCAIYVDPKNDNGKLLVAQKTVALSHEEHRTIRLPPGTYRIRIKRQYTPQGWAPVVD